LREVGVEARYLAGGIAGWAEIGLPRSLSEKSLATSQRV
jgi:hypothetical protein